MNRLPLFLGLIAFTVMFVDVGCGSRSEAWSEPGVDVANSPSGANIDKTCNCIHDGSGKVVSLACRCADPDLQREGWVYGVCPTSFDSAMQQIHRYCEQESFTPGVVIQLGRGCGVLVISRAEPGFKGWSLVFSERTRALVAFDELSEVPFGPCGVSYYSSGGDFSCANSDGCLICGQPLGDLPRCK